MVRKRSDSLVLTLLRGPDPLSDDACNQLLSVHRETRVLDFKKAFDPSNNGDWCKLVRHLVAMANTNGGYLIIGANDDGSSSKCDLQAVAAIDQATVIDKIGKYTDVQPDEVNLRYFAHKGKERVIFHVGKANAPIVFVRVGNYAITPNKNNKQETAFGAGTVYFRHGSKSEPARQADIQRAFDGMLAKRRREILAGVGKVIRAPSDHQVLVMPKSMRLTTDPDAPGVRLTEDPAAPLVRGLVGSGKYESLKEELAGIVRGFETGPEAYAAKAQLWRFYADRHDLTKRTEALRCLLVSSMYRHCPPYYWAYRLGKAAVAEVCLSEAKKDAYPGIQVTVRLAYAIAGNSGRRVLEQIAKQSRYPSTKQLAKRLLLTVGIPFRVWDEYGCRVVTIQTAFKRVQHQLDRDDLQNAELLIDEALALTNDYNKGVVKRLDALVYGTQIERQKEVG